MIISPIAQIGNKPDSPTRRKVLAGCVGLTATAAIAPWAVQATRHRRQAELFAFAAPDRDDVVFALAVNPRSLEKAESERLTVRLHVGEYLWTLEPFVLGRKDLALQSAGQLFSGLVSRVDRHEAAAHLIAVAVPAGRLPPQRLDVWAEIISTGGMRSRVGNPVVSRLLDDDARLSRLHAGLHPAVDRRLLSDAVANRIAARPEGETDPEIRARAKHLTGLILPDTLRFNPARPSGFTFAAMNGRRPDDAVDPVVQTILAGAPQGGRSDLQYRPSSQFPYFASTIAA